MTNLMNTTAPIIEVTDADVTEMFNTSRNEAKARQKMIEMLRRLGVASEALRDAYKAGRIANSLYSEKSWSSAVARERAMLVLAKAGAGRADKGQGVRTQEEQDAVNSANTAWSSLSKAADIPAVDPRGAGNRDQTRANDETVTEAPAPEAPVKEAPVKEAPVKDVTPAFKTAAELHGYLMLQAQAMAAVMLKNTDAITACKDQTRIKADIKAVDAFYKAIIR